MQLTLEQLVVPPGHQLLLKNISWEDFEHILEETGEARKTPRFSYSQGWMELMTPLAVHEDDKTIIGNLIEILLEELNWEFRSLGSVTLKNPAMKQAVEPDDCFYIAHEAVIRGKEKLDLSIDPPPDLALEIDITHRTHFDNYEKLGVPELWRFNGRALEILVFANGCYQASETSRQFPSFDVKRMIPEFLEKSREEGRNKTMRLFRQLVKESI